MTTKNSNDKELVFTEDIVHQRGHSLRQHSKQLETEMAQSQCSRGYGH